MASVTSLFADWNSPTTGYAQWTTDADTHTVTVQLTGAGSNTISNLTSGGCDFGSLLPSNTYTVHLTPKDASGVAGTTATYSFTTPAGTPPPDALTGLQATGNNGYVHLSWNPSNNATNYNIAWTGGGFAQTSSTTSDVMGLTNGTTYTFTVTPTNSSGTGGSQSVTATPNNRPSNFSFQFSIISSGANAVVDNRDWNNLGSKILAFRLYKSVGSYTFTQVTSTTGSITAALFNELVNGCSALIPYMANNVMPTTKSAGNDFLASYLNNIVTSINSIA